MTSHLTSCGIPGVGVVPYGMHLCHFYNSRWDLIDGLLPYFLAGLAHSELGIWIASPRLPATEIMIEISKNSTLMRGVASRQLKILDAVEWFGKLDMLKSEEIVQRCLDEEERAITEGYQGLRIAGDASFVARYGWDQLMDYEKKLHDRLHNRRIVACCSYDCQHCQPVDVLDVVRRHDAALDRSDQHWDVSLNSSKYQR